jgi:hypothetical protein
MSLNGLDDARVKEAHEAAVAEAGGWYVSARPSLVAFDAVVQLGHSEHEMLSTWLPVVPCTNHPGKCSNFGSETGSCSNMPVAMRSSC